VISRHLAASAQRQFAGQNRAAIYCEIQRWHDRYDCALDELYIELEAPTRLSASRRRRTKVKVEAKAGHGLARRGFENFTAPYPCRQTGKTSLMISRFLSTTAQFRRSTTFGFATSLWCSRRHDLAIGIGSAESLPDFLEQWRLANGHVDLATVRLTSGGIQFEAKAP